MRPVPKLPSDVLLTSVDIRQYGTVPKAESMDKDKTIGFWSAVFIIFNFIMGTGIFATPATVLSLSGSVGLSMTLWLLGGLYAAAGLKVFIVWGCAIPKNGAEKNYLEYLFPRPTLLITCLYAATTSLIGAAAGNAMVFGEYTLKAFLDHEPSPFLLKLTAFLCITSTFLLQGTAVEWGLRVQNILGVFKLLVLAMVAGTGIVALRYGIPTTTGVTPNPQWRGRENFGDIWQGTNANASSICLSLNSVIWSFSGYSSANYAMSEMRNPRRTIKLAGPLAVAVAACFYLFSNIAYLAGASKKEIIGSGRLVVSLLMRNIWGENTEVWVDVGVALSALGTVLAILFTQGRINQELGKEGALPLSKLWASNEPFNAPLAGLGLHWFVCVLIIFFVPDGDAFNLIVNLRLYPVSIVQAIISFGLIYLFFAPSSRSSEHCHYRWHHLSASTLVATIFFAIANLFLAIAPFVPPPPGAEPYNNLPYWTHAAGGLALFVLGLIWWAFRPAPGSGDFGVTPLGNATEVAGTSVQPSREWQGVFSIQIDQTQAP